MSTSDGNNIPGEMPVVSRQLVITSVADAKAVLQSKADLSNRLFDGLELSGVVARQSLFPGAVFRDCDLSDTDFSRCDFEAARFERCKFRKVTWTHADIRSCRFSGCDFNDCAMDEAYVSDCTFAECLLEKVAFDGSTLLRNRFARSILRGITNTTATMLHSEFSGSALERVKLGDCTALYSIFDGGTFKDFSINADALGLSYGLSAETLARTGFVFLGNSDVAPDEIPLPNAIIETYRERGWLLHALVAGMSLNVVSRLEGVRHMLGYFAAQTESNRSLNADEIEFALRLLFHLERRCELPFAAVISGLDGVRQLAATLDDDQTRQVSHLSSHLGLLAAQMEDKLREAILPVLFLDGQAFVVAEFHFESRPDGATGAHLMALADLATAQHLLLAARSGSWIQPIRTTSKGLLAVLVALYLFEGCIVKLTEIRARAEVLASSTLPQAYLDQAKTPQQRLPEEIRQAVSDVYTGYLKGEVEPPPADAGLNQARLQEVRILPQDAAATPASQ